MQRVHAVLDGLARQRGHLFPWVPVCLGVGIGLYFAIRFEPGAAAFACLGGLTVLLFWMAMRSHTGLRPLAIGLGLIPLGFLLAAGKTHFVAEPVLSYRYYGPVEGRIVAIDRSLSDKTRVTLDRVRLHRISARQTPYRVRIALHGVQDFVALKPGLIVGVSAHLSPPQGPAEPGGFNFQRKAWFDQLGAVGYTRSPMLALAPPERAGLGIFEVRRNLSLAMQDVMPGETGAFAAAILTGDRSAMSQKTLFDLRASNLAHLLAISGLHMGLLTGFVFACLRYGLALIPPVALRWPTKKIAAVCALIVAAIYLALSGGNVATERAFTMVAVMLLAVLMDRRALTLRAVALAAVIVLILRPDALTGPGFQMSFAATTALIAVFGWLKKIEGWPNTLPKWLRSVSALIISSAVAGLATAPIAAVHFNQIAQYGLLANLLTVPVMGTVVMPAAVVAAVAYPFGLSALPLFVMEKGIFWIMTVAHWVAGFASATSQVPTPPPIVLPLIVVGALGIMLWQNRVRVLGLPVLLLGFGLWSMAERPSVLVSADGRLLGVLTPEGRGLNKPKGQGFVARSWLENDGDRVSQDKAFARAGVLTTGQGDLVRIAQHSVLRLDEMASLDVLEGLCQRHSILIVEKNIKLGGPCKVWDPAGFRRSGALAISPTGTDLRITTANEVAGLRPWTKKPAKRRARSYAKRPSQ